MEVREQCDLPPCLAQDDPDASELAGLWAHTYQLWTSRDAQQAKQLKRKLEETSSAPASVGAVFENCNTGECPADESGWTPPDRGQPAQGVPPPQTHPGVHPGAAGSNDAIPLPRTPPGMVPAPPDPNGPVAIDWGQSALDIWLTKVHINCSDYEIEIIVPTQ